MQEKLGVLRQAGDDLALINYSFIFPLLFYSCNLKVSTFFFNDPLNVYYSNGLPLLDIFSHLINIVYTLDL